MFLANRKIFSNFVEVFEKKNNVYKQSKHEWF